MQPFGKQIMDFFSGLMPANSFPTYEKADLYQPGSFTYSASQVRRVEIHWIDGELLLLSGDSDQLSVTERSGALPPEQQVHWLIDQGTLYIRFCQSGLKERIDGSQKHLLVEIPQDAELTVRNVSAGIHADVLHTGALHVDSVSGALTMQSLHAQSAAIKSVSGNIRLKEATVQEDVSLRSISGSIACEQLNAPSPSANTISGNISLSLNGSLSAQVKSVSGRLSLAFVQEEGAEISYSSSSGHLKTDAEYVRTAPGKYLFGPGNCKVRAQSVSGNLLVDMPQ